MKRYIPVYIICAIMLVSTSSWALRKNVASQTICAQLNSSTDGSVVTSGTTTVYVTHDGTQSTGTGTIAHAGNGTWCYTPTQGETNYTHLAFTFTNATALTAAVQTYTVGYDPLAMVAQSGDSYSVVTALPSSAQTATAVWDALASAHTVTGSEGANLTTASTGGDPWIKPVPGSYTAGQAGYILGTNLNATISSRSTLTGVAQTGDSYARLGSPNGASIDADILTRSTYTGDSRFSYLDASISSRSTLTGVAQTGDSYATVNGIYGNSAIYNLVHLNYNEIFSVTEGLGPIKTAINNVNVGGSGNTAVTENTGGTDNLRFTTAGGAGIGGATITAYLKSDYSAGNTTTAYVKGTSSTKADGRWQAPIMLNSTFLYKIVFSAPGYTASAVDLQL